MTNQDDFSKDAADLRQKAEEQAQTMEPISLSAQTPEESQQMLHELRVHQIELEMQNEMLRMTQLEIEAGRARYFDLYEMAPVGYCTLSEKGLILEVNLTAATLLGVGRSALVKQPLSRFIFRDDQGIYYQHRKHLFETNEPQQFELRLVKPDGAPFWVQLTGTAAQGQDGELVCRVVVSDIAGRKRVEDELERNLTMLARTEHLANIGSWEWDIDADCTHWSEELFRIFQRDPALGAPSLAEHPGIYVAEDMERLWAAVQKCISNGTPYELELRAIRTDGMIRHCVARGKAECDEKGRIIRLVGSLQDITERQQAEEELKKIKWMLTSKSPRNDAEDQGYGDLTALNRGGLISRSISKDTLRDISTEYLNLLETSSAIYEKNGDYAYGIFCSGWCRLMDGASRRLCHTEDNEVALASGKWLCHESCWTNCSKRAIESRSPMDIECSGGIHLYAVPIFSAGEVIGAINFGYGAPPKDAAKQRSLAEAYAIDPRKLALEADAFASRPAYIIELAKQRLLSSARLIGIMVERKQAEEENRIFKTIADNAVYGKAIADLEGNLLYVNRFFANIHGYEPEQLIGKHLSNLHSQDQMESAVRFIVTMMREGYFATTTVWHCHRDGRAFPMLMNGTLTKDDYGNPQFMAVSAIDMSAHHLAQEAQRESEERFRSYFNLPLIGFAITSLEKGWVEVNERLCEILGYPREELISLTWTAITHPEDVERDVAQFNLILEGVSEGYSLEKRFIRKDGSVIHGSISVCCVRKPDRTINYFVALVQDITDRKQADADQKKLQVQLQQAQKMEAIGTLAGGIAHDFNNILGAILGYAEMAQEDSPAGSMLRQDIDQIVKGSHRARELVKQILAFSRQAETERIPLQPASIIKEAIRMLRSSLPSTIDIKQNIDMDAGLIQASPTQIHQIVMNLGTNAFHAMEETGGTLVISLEKKTLNERDIVDKPGVQPGDFMQLSVGDTGPGISPELWDKIFDPYFTTKEVGKGTGMGLAIIHGIVKSYGGWVSFQSHPGKGTVFQVLLPLMAEEALVENKPEEAVQFGNERILFIDDEEILAEMGKSMLERLGYQVTVQSSSIEALRIFQNQPDTFDLIITDQTMPGMTGSDLARRILQIRPFMPIILCTGYSSIITEEKTRSLGIKGFVMKPLTRKSIAVLIREVLEKGRPLSLDSGQ